VIKALVLNSGGVESATLLAHAKKDTDVGEIASLTFDYGQRNSQELTAAKTLAEYYRASYNLANLPLLTSESSLMGGKLDTYQNVDQYFSIFDAKEDITSSAHVPFRNGIFLAWAVHYAEVAGYDVVYAGPMGEWDYDGGYWGDYFPDCSPEFAGAFGAAVRIGTKNKVRLVTPFVWTQTKADVIKLGTKLGVPWELTFSCYSDNFIHCGECAPCLTRAYAFQKAEIADPTLYIKQPNVQRGNE